VVEELHGEGIRALESEGERAVEVRSEPRVVVAFYRGLEGAAGAGSVATNGDR
jgi:hypothetical protein